MLGVERDSLDWVREVPHHKVLYLDPPYNFRQYTAYYFLLNVLARYVDIDDLEAYFAGVRYVRGQNPADAPLRCVTRDPHRASGHPVGDPQLLQWAEPLGRVQIGSDRHDWIREDVFAAFVHPLPAR